MENNKIIFIIFGGRKERNYFFCSYFQHISLCFHSNFDRESSLDVEFDSASNEYPHCILLTDPTTPRKEIPEKMWWFNHHIFLGISYFWCSGVHQKYAVWVLVGCRIKFCIHWALLLRFWVKTQGDMLEIRNK